MVLAKRRCSLRFWLKRYIEILYITTILIDTLFLGLILIMVSLYYSERELGVGQQELLFCRIFLSRDRNRLLFFFLSENRYLEIATFERLDMVC